MLKSAILLLLTAHTSLRVDQVHVKGRFSDSPVERYLQHYCDQASLTPVQFVRKYRRLHETSPMDVHDSYSYLPCGVKGTIVADGHTFTWKVYVDDVLYTDYPDGRDHYRVGEADSRRD